MRRTWWVAALFLLPSLVLTLLLNAAISLKHGLGSPVVWVGFLVLPLVGGAGGIRRAVVRGLFSLGLLSLLLAAIVHLRLWTGAGGPVLEREGLVSLSRWALGAGAVAAALGWALATRQRAGDQPPVRHAG